MGHRKSLIVLAACIAVGCSVEQEQEPDSNSDLARAAGGPPRIFEWGEDYYNLTDGANALEDTLDLDGLERLFGAAFSVKTPFYVNQYSSIRCCPVPFGDQVYYVSEPLPVGSRNNSTFGYDFYIRKPDAIGRETDTSMSILFDRYRRMVSVTFRGGVFGSTRQRFVDPDTIEPTVQLAAAVRTAMFRAMKGDDHPEAYWREMPNFAEKFILAVDQNVHRN